MGSKPVTINYGNFLQNTFDFLVVALCIFLLVQAINKLKRKEAAVPPEKKVLPTAEEQLLMEIRDLLKSQVEGPAVAAGPLTPPVPPDISAAH